MTSSLLQEFTQHTAALRALARALIGESRADDIVQEAAIQAMTAPPQRPGPAGGWLFRVVRNLASKERRAERVRQRHEARAARPDFASADPGAEDADTLRRLTEIVTSLPEPYRQTILARYLREETPSEIAAATDTPVRTVKTRLQRGLVMLRERLGQRSADWRSSLIAAFALDPTIAVKDPMLVGATMKVAVFAAALLPIGLLLWNNFSAAASTPSEQSVVEAGRSAPVVASNPGAGSDLANQGGTDRRAAGASRTSGGSTSAGGGAASTADPALAPGAPVAAIAAQDPATAGRTAPAGASALDPVFMRFDAVGPAAFREAFGRTNLAAMLASEAGQALWRPLLQPVEKIWEQWDGRGPEFQAARERALDYAGRVRVLWMLQPGEDDEPDRMAGVFALEMDGRSDLPVMAGDLSRLLATLVPGSPTEESVGEHALRLLTDTSGVFVTLPTLLDGRLVAFFGDPDSLEWAVVQGLHALAQAAEPPSEPISWSIDFSQVRRLAGARQEALIVRLFGLESLQSLRATLSPRDVHAQFELEVVFGEGDRGLFAGLLPAVSKLPGMLARVPAAATPWLSVPLRLDVMFRAGLELAAAEDEEESVEAVRQRLHDDLGFHVDTELLDHLGGEIMVLGDLWQKNDPEAFRQGDDPPLGACLAFSLQDTAGFRRGFDKLLGQLEGTVRQFETREVEGVKITRLGSIFLTGMHMAVGQDLFAMAFGAEGVAQLEALVVSGPGGGGRELAPAIQNVRYLEPGGLNGLGLLNLKALLGGQVTLALELLDDVLPGGLGLDLSFDAQKWQDQLLPLIEEHDVADLVAMTGYDGGHWRLRVLW